jgi:hypothetical protein
MTGARRLGLALLACGALAAAGAAPAADAGPETPTDPEGPRRIAKASPRDHLPLPMPPALTPRGGDPALMPLALPAPEHLPERIFWVPFTETIAFNIGLWAVDRYAFNDDFARVSWTSIGNNLAGGWTWDTDDFNTNLVLHPYQGSVYATAARSAGYGFWGASAFAFGGSLLWKWAGENTKPSYNDMITTTAGGTILGEALFRISRLVLGRASHPGLLRRLGSAVVAPAAAFNDAVLEGRIQDPDPPTPPFRAWYAIGASAGHAATHEGSVSIPFQAKLGLDLVYGLPSEVVPEKPFDHFEASLDFSTATGTPWNSLSAVHGPSWLLSIRGLVAGSHAGIGDASRMLYGLFGTFDYGGPVVLRLSETGLGPGVVLALHPSEHATLEATFLAAGAFGSAGGKAPLVGDRDYRFAFGPFLVGDVRLLLGDRVELRATGRAFLVPAATTGSSGSETLAIASGSVLVRLAGPHAIMLDLSGSARDARYPPAPYHERSFSVAASYAYLIAGP